MRCESHLGTRLRYEARGYQIVQMVAWGDYGATGGFNCLEVGQLLCRQAAGANGLGSGDEGVFKAVFVCYTIVPMCR